MSTLEKQQGKEALRVFLSYAAPDRAYASKLRRLLSQRPNVRVFTMETLSAGEDWESKLKEELSQCEVFIVLLSPSSVGSNWILHELGAAWALSKPIVPIVTHPDVLSKIPLSLRGIRYVEIQDLEKPEIITQILDHYEDLISSEMSR